MNENFNRAITLYNLFISPDGDVWKRTVLQNCFARVEIIKSVSGNEISAASSFTVRIPASESYLPYENWAAANCVGWTLRAGDIVVMGEVRDEITPEKNAAKLLAKYKDSAFKIRAFTDNSRYTQPHYKVAG